jgi:hypothetical protein
MGKNDTRNIISDALAVEAEEAKRAGKVGYMARSLVQATLPHKATPGSEFVRRNGFLTLTILTPSSIGLPYGSIPRLLLCWITTEAFFTKSPVLQLGSTLSSFMSELGLLRTGGARGDITRLRNQIKRLFSSTVICHYADSRQDVGAGFNITSQYHLWWDAKIPHQIPLWKSTVTLGTDFFKEIIKSPVPIDMLALKQLKRSPLALDVYFWLTHRMFYLRRDTMIPWPLLQMQFGADYPADGRGPLDFKRNFLLRLKQVLAIYDTAVAFPVDGGLLLKPSPPHVAKQPYKDLPAGRRAIPPPDPVVASPMAALWAGDFPLRTSTYERAREIAPRLDIYFLENEWKAWLAKTGKTPKDPDKAFLGFVRCKLKQHGNL